MNKVSSKAAGFREQLLFEIASGVHRAAGRLPGERELCRRYGISRTTVRRTLGELTAAGILAVEPRRGCFVAPGALELIGRAPEKHALTVAFFIRLSQLTNPLKQTVFQTCLRCVDAAVRCVVVPEEEAAGDLPAGGDCDVAVFFDVPDEYLLKRVERRVKALILVNAVSHAFNFIAPDNYAGGRAMGELLLDYGHRRVGGIRIRGGADSEFGRRIFGCCDVLDEAGAGSAVGFIDGLDIGGGEDACGKAVDGLLAAVPALTALFCPADIVAFGAMGALRRRGVRVPEDIGVIAFDDQLYGQYTRPRLTTVKYPAEAMGIRLAETLNAVMAGGDGTIRELIAPVLVRRDSILNLNQ